MNVSFRSRRGAFLGTPTYRTNPVPAKGLSAKLVAEKSVTEPIRPSRCAVQSKKPWQPPGSPAFRPRQQVASRESQSLDHATVDNTPDFVPVSRAVAAWPNPSYRTLARLAARRLTAQTVSTSSLAGTDAGLTSAAMSPSVGAHAACLPKMISLEGSSERLAGKFPQNSQY